jgi:hypothetical protein
LSKAFRRAHFVGKKPSSGKTFVGENLRREKASSGKNFIGRSMSGTFCQAHFVGRLTSGTFCRPPDVGHNFVGQISSGRFRRADFHATNIRLATNVGQILSSARRRALFVGRI